MIAREAQHMPEKLDKVQVLQRKLYVAAKKDAKQSFGILYDKIYSIDVLWRAWDDVRKNNGSAGIDNVSILEVEEQGVDGLLRRQALWINRFIRL